MKMQHATDQSSNRNRIGTAAAAALHTARPVRSSLLKQIVFCRLAVSAEESKAFIHLALAELNKTWAMQ
jgi:hypothetical protein